MMHAERSAGPSDAPFDGEAGAARCRAMLGSVDDMHRSMQSMMHQHREAQAMPDSGDRRSGMGRGMMGGRMRHGGGSMDHSRGHMGMGEMNTEEMRGLCQTMHAAMRDVMHGDAPGQAGGSTDEGAFEGRGPTT